MMRRVLLLLLCAPAFGAVTITEGAWNLYAGTSLVRDTTGVPLAFTSLADCAKAADTRAPRTYTCRTRATVVVSGETTPPPPPPVTGTLFTDDFASGDLSKSTNGFRWGSKTGTAVVSDPGSRSGKALQFTFKQASANSWAEQRFALGGKYTDLWIRYVMLVDGDYAHGTGSPSNDKWLRLWSGNQSDGNDGYSRYCLKGGFSTTGKGGASSLISEWGSDGDGVGRNNTSSAGDWVALTDRGKEVTYVMHVRADNKGSGTAQNYPTNKGSGALEAWKNGRKVISLTDISWRCSGGTEYFTNGYVLGWANAGSPIERKMLLREFSISTSNVYGVQ